MIRNESKLRYGNVQNTPSAIDYTQTVSEDPLIQLAHGYNQSTGVIGYYGQYKNGSSTNYAGIHYDISQSKWLFFNGVATGPTNNNWTSSLSGNLSNLSVNSISTTVSNIGDPNIVTIGLTGSGASNIISASADLGAFLTTLFATNGDSYRYKIYAGTYTLTTTIIMSNLSNIYLEGAGPELTIILSNITSDNIFELNSTTSELDVTIRDLSIDNTAYTNAGAVGFYIKGLRKFNMERVNIDNCETGISLYDQNFFNKFDTVRMASIKDAVKLNGPGTSNKPNENYFNNCLFNNNYGTVVTITRGNHNVFSHCALENWATHAIYVDIGNGNAFTDCRLECNSIGLPPTSYITFTANAEENVVTNPYIADGGSSWVNRATSIVDSGSGNNIVSLATYKDQFINYKRDTLTAGDFIVCERSGSGDATALLNLKDSYGSSGTPNTLQIETNRSGGNFIKCMRASTGTTFFNVSGTGEVVTQKGMVIGGNTYSAQNSYLKMISSTGASDYDYQIIRNSGTNGTANIINKGTGNMSMFLNTSTEAFRLTTTGHTLYNQLDIKSGQDSTNFVRSSRVIISPSGASSDSYINMNRYDSATGVCMGYDISENAFSICNGSSLVSTAPFKVWKDGRITMNKTSAATTGYQFELNGDLKCTNINGSAITATSLSGITTLSDLASITMNHASNDVPIYFQSNGSAKYVIGYDTGGDSFNIQTGSSLTTTPSLKIQSDGKITVNKTTSTLYTMEINGSFKASSIVGGGDYTIDASDTLVLIPGQPLPTSPVLFARTQSTLTQAESDTYSNGIKIQPSMTGAYAITRYNYFDLKQPILGPTTTLTDACVARFDNVAGTHYAVDAGTTKTTPGTVDAWLKFNVNGTVYYVPAYTSKTT